MELRLVRRTDRFDETLAFYTQTLGWPIDRAWADGGRGVLIAPGGVARIELLEVSSADVEPVRGVFLSAEVEDAAAVEARISAAGHPVIQPLTIQPWGHLSVSTVDPSGMKVVLFQVV